MALRRVLLVLHLLDKMLVMFDYLQIETTKINYCFFQTNNGDAADSGANPEGIVFVNFGFKFILRFPI